jgi:hypothetical protein
MRVSAPDARRVDRDWICKAACILLIALNFAVALARSGGAGWDFVAYRSAVMAFLDGRDPYVVENLMRYSDWSWPFVYPPSTLVLFYPVVFFAEIVGYRFLWFLLLAASFLIVRSFDRDHQPLFLATILMTGFMASYHNFRTGNIGFIELAFFGLAFKFVYGKKPALSAIFVGLAAWFKVYPALIGGAFVFGKGSIRDRIKPLFALFLVLVLIGGSSWVFFPRLTVSYLGALTGRISGQHSPVKEADGSTNPSSFLFFKEAGERYLGAIPGASTGLYILCAGLILGLFIREARREARDPVEVFSMGTWAILLLLPRLKSYSLTLALIPAYFLMKDLDTRRKLLTLFLIGFAPLGLAAVYFVLRDLDLSSSWIGRQVLFLSEFRQWLSLLAAFVYLRRIPPRRAPSGPGTDSAPGQS